MSLGRSVPWTCWEEWHQVGEWLQSKDASTAQKGLDRVATWRSRGKVPLGVDSTACFVETRLRDKSGELSQLPLRMQYSLAVVRMVNGIADSSQKGRMAASVASLSAAAGLPRLLVDLRHEATHNELPSLAALQLAAHHALTWLHTNYWQRQKDHIELNKTKINQVICDYIASHMAAAIKAAAAAQRQDYDSDDEDAEDGGGGGGNTKIDPAAAAGISGDYNVAEARKQRQALLTELRVAVPTPAASLLIDGLVQAQIAASKESTSPVVVQRALTHAMKHLQEGWSQLPAILLDTAAVSLSPTTFPLENSASNIATSTTDATATKIINSASPPASCASAEWKLWIDVLAADGGNPKLVSISESNAQSILATCLLSLSEIEQVPLNRYLKNPIASATYDTTPLILAKERCSTLEKLIQVALPCLNNKDLQQRCLGVVSNTVASFNDQARQLEEMMATTTTGELLQMPMTGVYNEDLRDINVLGDLQKIRFEILNTPEGSKRPRGVEGKNIDDEDVKINEKKRKTDTITIAGKGVVVEGSSDVSKVHKKGRWSVFKQWQPCAIGMRSSAIDPNGRLPRLELETDFQLRNLPIKDGIPLPLELAAPNGVELEGGEQGGRINMEYGGIFGDVTAASGAGRAAAATLISGEEEEDEEEELDGISDEDIETAADEDEDMVQEDEELLHPAGNTGRCPPPSAVLPRI